MIFSIPLMIINLILAFLWLSAYQWLSQKDLSSVFGGKKGRRKYEVNGGGKEEAEEEEGGVPSTMAKSKSSAQAVKEVIASEYAKLGRWRTEEVTVGICFAVLVALWFLRNPRMFPGWLELFPYEVLEHLY